MVAVGLAEGRRELESEYQAARAALADPPKGSQGIVLVLSMVLFGLSMSSGAEPLRQIVVTVAVLLFHETGHYVGMRVFGFQDVRMFFIPFFGAAVAGKPRGVAAWKDGVVSLLGPLPGILVALVLAFAWPAPSPGVKDVLRTLIVINVLNLLPLGGFDGSRFLQRVLFSRHRYLEIAFLVVAGVALLGLALSQRMWVLALFAYFGLVLVPHRSRILAAAHRLRAQLADVTEARVLDDARGYDVFVAAREATHVRNREKPAVVAAAMDQIVEATKPPPKGLASLGLLGAWLVGFVAAVIAFVALAGPLPSAPASVKPFRDFVIPGGGFVVSLPEDTKTTDKTPPGDEKTVSLMELRAVSGDVAYAVTVETTALATDPEATATALTTMKLETQRGSFEGPVTSITHAGLVGRAVTLKASDGGNERCRITYLFQESRFITLLACGPSPDKLDGLLASFRPAP